VITKLPSPTVRVALSGAPGVVTLTVAGTEFPIIFVAVTVNVYSVPPGNPVNVNVLVDASVVSDKLSGDPVILYPVMAAPPLELGISHETVQLI
jgi:hypothetical protein